MFINPTFTLPSLSHSQKEKMLGCAEQALKAQQQMTTSKGKNIVHYTLEKKRRHKRFDHYPTNDRIDHATGAHYFYHCHRENTDRSEHGHFHCFLRYSHIPKRVRPTPLADWDKYIKNPMAHLVAIAMDLYGQPIRLFTINRWASTEVWYDAKHVPNFIKRYKMTTTDNPHWQVLDSWVESMLHLFYPQIAWLHHQRDAMMQQHILQNPDLNAYEDRKLEALSEISIDLKSQIQWLLSQ